jgi:hypothetical protein
LLKYFPLEINYNHRFLFYLLGSSNLKIGRPFSMPTVEESSGRRRKGRKKLGDQMSVQSKKELKLLLCHPFPPLGPFSLLHKPKPEFLLEVACRMKSLEGL